MVPNDASGVTATCDGHIYMYRITQTDVRVTLVDIRAFYTGYGTVDVAVNGSFWDTYNASSYSGSSFVLSPLASGANVNFKLRDPGGVLKCQSNYYAP